MMNSRIELILTRNEIKRKIDHDYDLTVRDIRIRIALDNEMCYKCHQDVYNDNWTLDRINNQKGSFSG